MFQIEEFELAKENHLRLQYEVSIVGVLVEISMS